MNRPCLLLLALLLLLAPVAAQETAPVVTPAERFRAAVAAMPAPAADRAFSAEGEMMMGSLKIGTFRFSAEAVAEGDAVVWKINDLGSLEVGDQKFLGDIVAFLGAHFEPVRGSESQTENGVPRSSSWTRSGTGITVAGKKAADDAAETTTDVPLEGAALVGMSSLLLLARHLPAEAAEYEFTGFDALPNDGIYVKPVSLAAKGPGEWNGQPALLFSRRDEQRTISFGLDPESRAFLGMRMEEEGGPKIEFRLPATRAPETVEAGPFSPPAKSAKQAALIAALAFGTGDGSLLDRVVSWPAVFADLKKKNPAGDFTEEQIRQNVIARLDEYEGASREMILAALEMVGEEIVVEEKGEGRAVVRFPEAFQNLAIEVGLVEGDWMLVALPGT